MMPFWWATSRNSDTAHRLTSVYTRHQVIHVHADEAVRLRTVEAAAVLQRVRQSFFAVIEGVLDAGMRHPAYLRDHLRDMEGMSGHPGRGPTRE